MTRLSQPKLVQLSCTGSPGLNLMRKTIVVSFAHPQGHATHWRALFLINQGVNQVHLPVWHRYSAGDNNFETSLQLHELKRRFFAPV